jgi:hypothetical protein
MTTGKKVGGEVVAFCTKCRMDLAHTIIAMDGTKPARVQCNTCNGQHNYRGKAEAAAKAPKAPKAAKTAKAGSSRSSDGKSKSERVRLSFEDQVASKRGGARVYSTKSSFIVDELVNHPTFGVGYVEGVRLDKVDVVFKSGTKTLVHGRK